ncbi:hypothetical protein MACK_003083 [Theileria orientalis]|uniref:J domain-containing protein n=1 Tax=Theileria orientalis TaxID=68886 RepID=A0A976MFL4_THEOR|nr:hypothetical protein MACK_003083 [Theileria orientalis]
MDEVPSILQGVDIFALLDIKVDENVDVEESKKNLRRSFLQKARKYHPDKQSKHTGKDEHNDVEFVRIKAAFDYLQTKNNFTLLYNKVLSELRAKRRRLERSKDIATKQASYLDSLLKREKEAQERRTERQREAYGQESSQKYEEDYYDEIFASTQRQQRELDPSLGQLIVAAKTQEIANGSEINCLLMSSHFPTLFDNYGLVSVEPLEFIDTQAEKNVRIGKIYFTSEEHAVRALLHYRSNRAKFRCDLYALALGKDEPALRAVNETEAFERYEELVLRRFRLVKNVI